MSVISSWDMGGHWIEPPHASMGLYPTEITIEGGREVDIELPFPPIPAAPLGADGKPAVLARCRRAGCASAKRGAGHEFVFRLDTTGGQGI
jgi:hypothetical protein